MNNNKLRINKVIYVKFILLNSLLTSNKYNDLSYDLSGEGKYYWTLKNL